jgi:hypothetical protein
MSLLFDPTCGRPIKRFRDDAYEISICQGMMFTSQQAADILTSNAKVSADGSINTHSDVMVEPAPTNNNQSCWSEHLLDAQMAKFGESVPSEHLCLVLSNHVSHDINTT